MAVTLTSTLNTCCSGCSRFQASFETKMKKRASWNHAGMCTTLLLWNCRVCQRAKTDGNSAGNNIDKHMSAPGHWAKIGEWKRCLLGNPSGELPHHAAAHAQLHSACCCQPDDILLWKNTLKSWHEMIRILLDFQLVASTVQSKVLKSSARMWLNMVVGDSILRWKMRELRAWASPKTVSHQRKLS